MRIHALDASGSFYVFRQKAYMALRRYAKDDDLIVLYTDKVTKPVRWGNVKGNGEFMQAKPLDSGKPATIFKWMEGRFLSCHDTLIVYGDFCDPSMPTEDTFYRTEFVVFGNYNGQRFFNDNVYRVGESEEGYAVVPFPEHISLQRAKQT